MKKNETLKINKDQFTMDTQERNRLWEEKRRHFSDYCINRFQWYNYPKWKYVNNFPLHIDFEASFRCNLNCVMCFRQYIPKKDYNDMDFDLFKKGIDECAENNLYSIRLSWRGEPTMNPRLIDMIVYAQKKGIKEISFISNGMNINKPYAKELIKAGLDYLTISIDTLGEKYNELRKPADFDIVVQNLRNIYELRNKIGNGYPRIKIQGIMEYLKNIEQEYYDYFKDITDLINYNEYDDYSKEELKVNSNLQCQYPWQRLTVTWNGEIPMCISDWGVSTQIGDLKNESLTEIWHGKKINEIRQKHSEGKLLDYLSCKKCYRLAER